MFFIVLGGITLYFKVSVRATRIHAHNNWLQKYNIFLECANFSTFFIYFLHKKVAGRRLRRPAKGKIELFLPIYIKIN